MNIEQSVLDFISGNLSKDAQRELPRFFESINSQDEVIRRLSNKSRNRRVEGKKVIDDLSNSESQLLLATYFIEEWKDRADSTLSYRSKTSIHTSEWEVDRIRKDVEPLQKKCSNLDDDLGKIHRRIYSQIEARLGDTLPHFLESNALLTNRCNPAYEITGYHFCFYGNKIVVENWYPMGGD